MTPDEFLRRLDGLSVWKRGDQRAPHKPLLLLLALGRVARGAARLSGFGSDIEAPLDDLLRRFGPPRVRQQPAHPFERLANDGLWEIPGATGRPGRPLAEVRKLDGGFPADLHSLLQRDPELVERAASHILADHFPESLHREIRDRVGLFDSMVLEDDAIYGAKRRRPRDPRFREKVLTAYERCCAVCGYDIRLSDGLFGLDAAHIRWHSHGGPDTTPNGLALCAFHHRALDGGAIGLEREAGAGFVLIVSRSLSGQSEDFRRLVDARGRPLRPPQERKSLPNAEFVAWHRKQVFRGEPRGG